MLISDVFFVPVITFFVYFVVDYIGRELAAVVKKVVEFVICRTEISFSVVAKQWYRNLNSELLSNSFCSNADVV